MLLKANAFVYMEVREENKQRQAKVQFMEKAKQLKAQRENMRAVAVQTEAAIRSGWEIKVFLPGPFALLTGTPALVLFRWGFLFLEQLRFSKPLFLPFGPVLFLRKIS